MTRTDNIKDLAETLAELARGAGFVVTIEQVNHADRVTVRPLREMDLAPTTSTVSAPEEVRTTALIAAAEERATAYDGDDRSGIKNDVINAFYAGSEWERRRSRAATDQPSAGQVDERASINDDPEFGRLTLTWADAVIAANAGGSKVSLMNAFDALVAFIDRRASLTPTAPQAASQQAEQKPVARLQACTSDRPHSVGETYFDIVILDRPRCYDDMELYAAPQAATTASTSDGAIYEQVSRRADPEGHAEATARIDEALRAATTASASECNRCEGSGYIETGIDESPTRMCLACDGAGRVQAP